MLKYLTFLPLLLVLLFKPILTAEPETPQYMVIEAFQAARIIAAKEAQVKAEAEIHRKAVDNLVNYLERKWKRPRNEIRETVTASFALTTKNSASRSQQDWPQPLDLLAVVQVESGFNRQARDSQSGSVGLMQINTDDHHISIEKLTKPSTSISYGLALLYKYRREMQSESRALVAYNQGPVSAANTCGRRRHCETPYTIRVALAKKELTRHFN
jgi:hypothetical protein